MKFDQPEAAWIIDRDNVAALGLNLAQVGADVALAVGGNFVNRFNIDGYSYKVIAQIERSSRLNAEQLLTGESRQLRTEGNKLQEAGRSRNEAAQQAAMTRLRPVLMTSVATIAGHFPLTLVTGAGAEARNSIGLVLVGGMAIGTVFTLFVLPSLYVLIAREHTVATNNEEESRPA